MTHLRKNDDKGKVFVAKDLTDKYGVVVESQIVKLLPLAHMDSRGHFHFAEPIEVAK